jgi:hypothetical protein
MIARPRRVTSTQRRLLLSVHVALSVGWLGASMVMLVLAIAARASQPGEHASSAYWAMHLLADVLLIPLSLSVLLVGVAVGSATPWGLLRYRWVLVKLLATSAAVVLSLLALPAMTDAAYRAATQHALAAERSAGTRLIIAGSVSVALYLSLTAISVLKPWGRTARGERRARQTDTPGADSRTETSFKTEPPAPGDFHGS